LACDFAYACLLRRITTSPRSTTAKAAAIIRITVIVSIAVSFRIDKLSSLLLENSFQILGDQNDGRPQQNDKDAGEDE
jgi:hypothetical protein